MKLAESLIEIERKAMVQEGAWLLESAETVADRSARGILRLSVVNDVIAHAESLKRRLQAIETLEKVLP